MDGIRCILGIHAHHPLGNFPAVFADAYRRSYAPFLSSRFGVRLRGMWLAERVAQQVVFLPRWPLGGSRGTNQLRLRLIVESWKEAGE